MDPMLEEMARVKGADDIRYSRFRDWVTYFDALLVSKDARIADLEDRLADALLRLGQQPAKLRDAKAVARG